MELAAQNGRARRGRSYLRILGPPPTFSVSFSGAELRKLRAGHASPFPHLALVPTSVSEASRSLGKLPFHDLTRSSRRALIVIIIIINWIIPALTPAAAYLIFLFFIPLSSFFYAPFSLGFYDLYYHHPTLFFFFLKTSPLSSTFYLRRHPPLGFNSPPPFIHLSCSSHVGVDITCSSPHSPVSSLALASFVHPATVPPG